MRQRCAIYARYSSEEQSPNSNDDQVVRICEPRAEREGWSVVKILKDAEISGATTERPGYQELLRGAFATPPEFDIILVESVDRLTRDIGELDRLYKRLRLKGVHIVGVNDGVDTRHEGATVQLAVNGLKNQLFLEDLSKKTHRGLAGVVARGLSTGGRIFGYRAVPIPGPAPGSRAPAASARFEIYPPEAQIVRRIFQAFAHGRSLQMVAHALNREQVPSPAQETKRGQGRRGWSPSTVRVILRNEKYVGVWIWNKTQFLRDPQSGRRQARPRPPEQWDRRERPELAIVDPALWAAVQARFQGIRDQYGVGQRRPPRNGARPIYSAHLLSGALRCGACAGKMWAETARRTGAAHYLCGVARTRGPALCTHRTRYEQAQLEGALIEKFRQAMTPAMVGAVVDLVNEKLDQVAREWDTARAEAVKAEILRLEREVGNLARFVADGDTSPTVREQLRVTEQALEALRREYAQGERRGGLRAHRAWVERRLEHLDELLRRDVPRARLEIAKHLDGPLTVTPLPAVAGERRAEISGQVRSDSLLAGQAEQNVMRCVVGCGGLQLPLSKTLIFEAQLI